MEDDPRLTTRENEVLDRVRDGESTTEIAAALFIEVSTARNHINSAMTKTGTHSRVALLAATLHDPADRGAVVVAFCAERGWRLSRLQAELIVSAFLVTESGCDGAAHQWPPKRAGHPWTCLCGAMTVG